LDNISNHNLVTVLLAEATANVKPQKSSKSQQPGPLEAAQVNPIQVLTPKFVSHNKCPTHTPVAE
jgi:hypothetical protein